MHQPLVTIIVPSYNCASYLGDTIESLYRQTYENYEICIVDDGSTDNTRELIQNNFSRNISYFYQDNKGVSAARNTGLGKARGELVAFIDADDTWREDKLALQVNAITASPDIIAVFSNFTSVDEASRVLVEKGMGQEYAIFTREKMTLGDLFDEREAGTYRGNIFSSLFLGNFILTSTLMVKREYTDACGLFDTRLVTQEDYDYFLRLAGMGKFAFIDEPLSSRRKRSGQLTDPSMNRQIAEDVVAVIEKHLDIATDQLERNQVNLRLRKKYRELALNYIAKNQGAAARKILVKSMMRTGARIHDLGLFVLSIFPSSLVKIIKRVVSSSFLRNVKP